jgi:hypothetical protein
MRSFNAASFLEGSREGAAEFLSIGPQLLDTVMISEFIPTTGRNGVDNVIGEFMMCVSVW